MSGMISVRVTSAERRKLLALKAERGCSTMSQVIRLMLGFPRSAGPEIFEGADDIDSVGSLVKNVLAMIDRLDTNNETLYKLAQMNGLKEVRHRPLEALVEPRDGPPEFRGGHKHPALPEGFTRS